MTFNLSNAERERLSLSAFLRTEDIGVHIVQRNAESIDQQVQQNSWEINIDIYIW